jgi:citrate lyase beta subunit
MSKAILGSVFKKEANKSLADVDALLATRYAGDSGGRQPVHTCYIPADRYHATSEREWGDIALRTLSEHAPNPRSFAQALNIAPEIAEEFWDRLHKKLETEPIEDIRVDFEDGYGRRNDSEEDDHLESSLDALAAAATSFSGARIKSFEAITRDRGLRTLDLLISGLVKRGGIPEGFVVTLPKVTFVEQVEVMAQACKTLEKAHKLKINSLRFEIQIETAQAIYGPNGKLTATSCIDAAQGRLTAFHYGTYDYSAALSISAAHQSLDHPAADLAKGLLQIAAAGTGVHLSDGSTNIIPAGDASAVHGAWRNHYRLVRRSLERGFYQGWDLHGAQLPTRFAANFAFYRENIDIAASRLRIYLEKVDSGIMDEPATALALAGYFLRGLDAGALTNEEVEKRTGQNSNGLRNLVARRGQSS